MSVPGPMNLILIWTAGPASKPEIWKIFYYPLTPPPKKCKNTHQFPLEIISKNARQHVAESIKILLLGGVYVLLI